jgi:hypothetical protein
MNQQVLSNKKIPIDVFRRLYQAIVANIALWGSESWALEEEDRPKLETFHHGSLHRMRNLSMWDIAEKWSTNERIRRNAANSPKMESMMEGRRCQWLSKLSMMEKSRSPRFTTNRETAADHTPYLHNHSKNVGFEQEKG